MENERHEDHNVILEFQDNKKLYGTSNVKLQLVLTAIIVNHLVLGILIDNKSFCGLYTLESS